MLCLNIEHDTIAVTTMKLIWSMSTKIVYSSRKLVNLDTANIPNLLGPIA